MDKEDHKIIALFSLEITDRFKKIMERIPKEKEFLLKNLASCSIHLTMFIKDIYNEGANEEDKLTFKEFLFECGCKDYLDDKIH